MSPALPPFGDPILRACEACEASVYCTSWDTRCPKCGDYIINRGWIEVIEQGISVKIVGGALTVELDTEDPTPIR